ncbi:MAG: hypothetical protein ACOZFS_09490 [Thermodesulfobacteriota bacterium]
MRLNSGCRLAYLTGLMLEVLSLLGARAGSLIEPPDVSILKIPTLESGPKPPVRFSHRLHEAKRVAYTSAVTSIRGSATSGAKAGRWKGATPAIT